MLLRLSVSNFKSIRAAQVRFGPLTCLLGHNGVGKSNLFDAVQFLSLLADRDVYGAASDVRRSSGGSSSPLDLIRGRDPGALVELSADMVVPDTVKDDFGRTEKTSATLLTYRLVLRYDKPTDRLLVQAEELSPVALGRFEQFLGFAAKRDFRGSVAKRSRRGGALISTDADKGVIALHGDGGSRGRPAPIGTSPLTVVGGTSTVDYPTVLAAKREMLSWRALQLEPSAMRAPDRRGSDPHITDAGGAPCRHPRSAERTRSACAASGREPPARAQQ